MPNQIYGKDPNPLDRNEIVKIQEDLLEEEWLDN
jgi:hypothetical protein